jgi:hypothetical protein
LDSSRRAAGLSDGAEQSAPYLIDSIQKKESKFIFRICDCHAPLALPQRF